MESLEATTPSSGETSNSRGLLGKDGFVWLLAKSSCVSAISSPSFSTVKVKATGIRARLCKYTSCLVLKPENNRSIIPFWATKHSRVSCSTKIFDEIFFQNSTLIRRWSHVPRAVVPKSRLSLSKCKVGHMMQPLQKRWRIVKRGVSWPSLPPSIDLVQRTWYASWAPRGSLSPRNRPSPRNHPYDSRKTTNWRIWAPPAWAWGWGVSRWSCHRNRFAFPCKSASRKCALCSPLLSGTMEKGKPVNKQYPLWFAVFGVKLIIRNERIATKSVYGRCNRMDLYLVIVHGTHVDVVQIDRENVQL